MALVRWSPFREPDDFFGEEDWDMVPSLFPKESFRGPAIDVYEEGDDIVAEAELPNIDPQNVDISIEDDILDITGTYEQKSEDKDKQYYKREIRRGKFSRQFALPQSVKAEEAEANYDEGVLEIRMPKEEPEKSDKVKVEID
jgi:HSP20 family protein